MLIKLLAISLTTLFYLQGFAQNSSAYFKVIPHIDKNTPKWAQLMYSDNPNVDEVTYHYNQYFKSHKIKKTIHTQNFKFWMQKIEDNIGLEGFIVRPSLEQEKLIETQLIKEREAKSRSLRTFSNEWYPMGPFETFKIGTNEPISKHKNIYSIDRSLTNPDLLICGTASGGVYKSVDKGMNWFLITKNEAFCGNNSAVEIHPTDPNNFLVASNHGVYQSLDGGNTWSESLFTNGTGDEFIYSNSNTDLVFHTSATGLYKSIDAGHTWVEIFNDWCYDVDFHPTNPNIVYLLKQNAPAKRDELFRSDDGGNTWVLKDNNYYTPSDMISAATGGGKIGVTPSAPDMVYVCLIGASKAGDNGWIGVYKSSDKGENWVNPSGQDGSPYSEINSIENWNVASYGSGYHQGYYNFDFEVSESNPLKLWVGTLRLAESTDGGQTFISIGATNSTRLEHIHSDIQAIEVYGDEIWLATDGGAHYSNDELMTHSPRNRGIQAATFWLQYRLESRLIYGR